MKWRWIYFCLPLLLIAGLAGWRWYLDWLDHSQDIPILAAARRYGVEPALVKAVVWKESRFNPRSRGAKGEIGLMQVMPRAAALDWSNANHGPPLPDDALFDPATNTMVGTWYLDKLLKRYPQADNPVPYALADYNAGRGNVLKWSRGTAATNSAVFMEQIGFAGTKHYVRAILERRQHYRPIFPPETK